jgi:uncharacterized phage-associated protein
MATADDVAAAVLRLTGAVTTKKLQKLVYYSQAWHLARYSEAIFAEEIEAWVEGPVVRSLWSKHRKFYSISEWPTGNQATLTGIQLNTIQWVVSKYGNFSAESLSRMTHAETPWLIARSLHAPNDRSSEPIKKDHMRSFYARQHATPDVAVALAAANSAIEGVELDTDWQELLREVADGSRSADDLIKQQIRRVRGN